MESSSSHSASERAKRNQAAAARRVEGRRTRDLLSWENVKGSDTQEQSYRCSDCKHAHGGAPHGFCRCGCTYPGEEKGEPQPIIEKDYDGMRY